MVPQPFRDQRVHLNSYQPSIQFMREIEENGGTSLSGDKEPREKQTQVHCKPTHTERYVPISILVPSLCQERCHLHSHQNNTTHLQQQK